MEHPHGTQILIADGVVGTRMECHGDPGTGFETVVIRREESLPDPGDD